MHRAERSRRSWCWSSAAGLWIAEHPIPDLFALLPFEFAKLLFHDPVAGAALLTGGLDFSNMEAVAEFYIGNARRMGDGGQDPLPHSEPPA